MDLPLYAVLAFAPAGSSIAFAEALEWWPRGNGATRSGAASPGRRSDDTLCACCEALEIRWSGRRPLTGSSVRRWRRPWRSVASPGDRHAAEGLEENRPKPVREQQEETHGHDPHRVR